MQVVKNVNWDKINEVKEAGRLKVAHREAEQRRVADEERQRRENISSLRRANFMSLLRTEIGDLADEFHVTASIDDDNPLAAANDGTDGEDRAYSLSQHGLCSVSRTAFFLHLPGYNPIHVYVLYGGTNDGVWVDSDYPKFNDLTSKFSVYMDPEYRRKIVNRIRKINRVDTSLTRYAKGYGFDNIGEALVVAEEFYRTHHDPDSPPNVRLREQLDRDEQVKEVGQFARQIGLDSVTTDELIAVPGGTLSEKIQSLFTLSKQNNNARSAFAVVAAAQSQAAKSPVIDVPAEE